MRRNRYFAASLLVTAAFLGASPSVSAVDFESFEFSESQFTELDATANTANPGNNWSTDINVLTDSFTDGAGNFKVAKFNDDFAASYLQIDNLSAGSRFISVDMAGWELIGSVVGQGEEIRFAFLNDDTGNDGSTVAAEVRIDRNTTTEAIELRGVALGAGATNISSRATLNTIQTAPFRMVLEINKTSNTYEIFYKDGSNPSQSLGIGSVAPSRDGNSIRFVINNNFGTTIDEEFLINRFALTDTNPLTDLLTVEVNRVSGETKLINTSGATVSGVQSVSITSDVGAFDPAGFIDFSGTLTAGQQVTLSTGAGPWIQNLTEDFKVDLNFAGNVTRSANVNFVGNNGERFDLGDLTFDGALTAADWTVFIAGAETNLSGLSAAEAYQAGDLDGDGVNSILDFGIFEAAFDTANGLGSFQAMLASVPEPSTLSLFALSALGLISRRSRHQN